MQIIGISPNLFIINNPKFGNYDASVIKDILCFVDLNMSKALGLKPFSSKCCLIDHTEGVNDPETRDWGEYHLILLNTQNNCWCQWLYQFAHEYCHHLINGPMVLSFEGQIWFEEMICEVSSLYNLISLAQKWAKSSCPDIEHNYASNLRTYVENEISKPLKTQLNGQHPQDREQDLYIYDHKKHQMTYNRELYTYLGASSFLPQVIQNPQLWRIILHIGNSREYHSIDELFTHLRVYADPSYSRELEIFRSHLLRMLHPNNNL